MADYNPFVSQTNEPLSQSSLAIVGICLIILTLGIVAAMLLFILLCFRYPSSANIIVPLILVPAGGVISIVGKKAVVRVKRILQTSAASKDNKPE